MGNLVTYKGEVLATYYLEKKGTEKKSVDGYVFEFEGLEALTKLLNAPDTDKTDEGELIVNIKLMLKSDLRNPPPYCLGIFLSPSQRVLNQSKD